MKPRKTHSEFINQVKNRPFDVIGRYSSARTKILYRCHVDGHEWMAAPYKVAGGSGCPKCAGKCGNDVIMDHGDWIEVDVSTSKFPNSIMKICKHDYYKMKGDGYGRVLAARMGNSRTVYAVVAKGGKHHKVHRVVLEASGLHIDHINHDGLDNRRSNIRLCTNQQNRMNYMPRKNNKSGVVGVSWCSKRSKWVAQIVKEGVHHHLGHFATIEEAAIARRAAELKYFGEFAPKH